MKPLFTVLAAIWLLVLSNPAYAGTCGYKDCWGGVGFGADGQVGWAYGQWSEKEAYKVVLQSCGFDCKQVRTFKNSCAAIAKGDNGNWTWSTQPSRSAAEDEARQLCRHHTHSCRIVVWSCSP